MPKPILDLFLIIVFITKHDLIYLTDKSDEVKTVCVLCSLYVFCSAFMCGLFFFYVWFVLFLCVVCSDFMYGLFSLYVCFVQRICVVCSSFMCSLFSFHVWFCSVFMCGLFNFYVWFGQLLYVVWSVFMCGLVSFYVWFGQILCVAFTCVRACVCVWLQRKFEWTHFQKFIFDSNFNFFTSWKWIFTHFSNLYW